MKKHYTPEELFEMDLEIDKLNIERLADNLISRAEIIPIVSKEDESFLLNEHEIPDDMPLLPLRGTVLFPGVVMPIAIGRKGSLKLVREAERKDERIIVVAQRNDSETPMLEDLFNIGVIARVLRVIELPNKDVMAVLQGTMKCSLESLTQTTPYYRGHAMLIDEIADPEHPRLFHSRVIKLRKNYVDIMHQKMDGGPSVKDMLGSLNNIASDRIVINYIASHLDATLNDKQNILEAFGYEARIDLVEEELNQEREFVKFRSDLHDRTRHEIDRQQREYFLNQQMRVIQDELGGSPVDQDLDRLQERADRKKWPDEVAAAFQRSMERLRRTPPQTPDFTVELNYAELLLELPWMEYTKDDLNISRARKVLDKDHYGMEKIKERIIEYLAVMKLKGGSMKSPILCFVGPPGTGKTSLGKSIATAMKRKYVRVALGGLHDESEIRGHRKTYVGAMPGRIIQNIKRAGVSNPVFVLDEIDKVQGMSHNGDPTSALLEVLDPEQNNAFHDNYLDLDFDLSNVLFIATANSLSTIQPALLDRMEIIDLSGYVLEEKIEIAQRHLVPRQLEEHGLDKKAMKFDKEVLSTIINDYTRESGVRQLEKTIAKVVRHRAVQLSEGGEIAKVVNVSELKGILGLPIHNSDRRGAEPRVGVVTGLAWTQVGGEILFIESSLSKGKGTISMTGNLGDVMKESATLAFEYLKANAAAFGIEYEKIENSNIHIHVPEGATPKDGPSAGITMFVAMVSAFTQKHVSPTIAMTGEITLRGAVTPVGGIKEKILAAKRADITDLILCEDNRRDIEDIPSEYLKGLTFHYIKEMKDALPIAFVD
ncbi:MAG: endopeptidase La [Bacteroidales bacterium]|nr:endopeptidase La [Bacteroidales bacterium]